MGTVLPRFVVKVLCQYLFPSDIQIAREAEKFGFSRELGGGGSMQIEMNPILEPQQRLSR